MHRLPETDRRHPPLLCAAGALLLAGCAGTAPDPRAAAIAELGATGKLRAAINFGNPILASRGAGGEPQGVSVDLAREAARRLGLADRAGAVQLRRQRRRGRQGAAGRPRLRRHRSGARAPTWSTPRPT